MTQPPKQKWREDIELAAEEYRQENLHYHDSDGVDVAQVWRDGAHSQQAFILEQQALLDECIHERDTYAKAMEIALREGVFVNKSSVKKQIEELLTKLRERKGESQRR